MADKKVEKALYGPSTMEVALGAVLGLALGVVLAGVYLVFKPVLAVKEMPKEPAKGVVYYLSGRTDSNKARGWQQKMTAFTKGGAVIATEEELNAWAASVSAAPAGTAKPPAPGAPAPAAAAPAGGDFLSASGLNFRLEGERMHVAQKVLLNYFGLAKEVVMQAEGGFTRTSDGFVFQPERLHLGSCPVHLLPGASGALTKALVSKQKVPDDFRAAWAKVTGVVVEGGLLKITTQP